MERKAIQTQRRLAITAGGDGDPRHPMPENTPAVLTHLLHDREGGDAVAPFPEKKRAPQITHNTAKTNGGLATDTPYMVQFDSAEIMINALAGGDDAPPNFPELMKGKIDVVRKGVLANAPLATSLVREYTRRDIEDIN